MEDLIPIGQFAQATRLSLMALRLYDENGLLPPAHVDSDSGRRVLDDPSPVRITDYEAGLVEELEERRRILAYVQRVLKEEQMFEVQLKQVPEQRYVSRSGRVRVPELEPFIIRTIEELSAEHEPAGPAFSLYHGEVSERNDGPVEVCVPAGEGDKRLAAGEVAYTRASGSGCTFPEILGAYDAVAGWAKANGRELVGPPREIYLAGLGEGEAERLEIAWPVR